MWRPEDAKDVAQETFLAAVRTLGEFRGDASITTWHDIGDAIAQYVRHEH